MRNFIFAIVLAIFCVTTAGCGNTAEGLAEQQVSLINQMAAALENGASEDKIKRLSEQVKTASDKLSAMDLSIEERSMLMRKYHPRIIEANKRLMEAMAKSLGVGGFESDLPPFAPGR